MGGEFSRDQSHCSWLAAPPPAWVIRLCVLTPPTPPPKPTHRFTFRSGQTSLGDSSGKPWTGVTAISKIARGGGVGGTGGVGRAGIMLKKRGGGGGGGWGADTQGGGGGWWGVWVGGAWGGGWGGGWGWGSVVRDGFSPSSLHQTACGSRVRIPTKVKNTNKKSFSSRVEDPPRKACPPEHTPTQNTNPTLGWGRGRASIAPKLFKRRLGGGAFA